MTTQLHTKPNTILAADLFCGAGGGTSGFLAACDELGLESEVLAINHWTIAIETHSQNHPNVRHMCENLDTVHPREVVPGGKLHFAVFAPECISHSRARGGKPMNSQSRATAWHVIRWCEELDIENVLVENVEEFLDWGPLYPENHPDPKKRLRPIPEKKGEFYRNWRRALQLRGYKVAHRVLNAAHYGAATSRKRLFVQARKNTKITWPKQTHSEKPFVTRGAASVKPLRAAREIIDWSIEGRSIYTRERPLAPNTMARIEAGLRKFSGLPFIVPQFASQGPRDIERPLGTITTQSRGVGLCEPYLVVLRNNCDALSIDGPVPTLCSGGNHVGVAEPFFVKFYGGHDACSLNQPLGTVTANYEHFGLAEPFIVPVTHTKAAPTAHNIDLPLKTITTAKGGEFALAQPFLVKYHGNHKGRNDGAERVHSVDEVLKTLDTSNRYGLAEPFLVKFKNNSDGYSLDKPLDTLTTKDTFGLAEPFLIEYYGNSHAASVDSPLPTVTTRDRFALVHPQMVEVIGLDKGDIIAVLDIRFRMLQPHELAAAMGFRKSYSFAGNREAQVKQIGNAIEFHVMKALCAEILKPVAAEIAAKDETEVAA